LLSLNSSLSNKTILRLSRNLKRYSNKKISLLLLNSLAIKMILPLFPSQSRLHSLTFMRVSVSLRCRVRLLCRTLLISPQYRRRTVDLVTLVVLKCSRKMTCPLMLFSLSMQHLKTA